jgi:class 3 adenylate cyclase
MDTVDPIGPTVIAAPEGEPLRGTPLLVCTGLLALAIGASFAAERLMPGRPLVDLCAKLLAIAAALGFATALERAIMQRIDAQATARRALTAALVIAAAVVIGIGGGIGCLRLAPALGDRGALGLTCFVAGLWLCGLALGTLFVSLAGSRGGTLKSRLARLLFASFLLAAIGSLAGARFGAHWLQLVTAKTPDMFAVFSPHREHVELRDLIELGDAAPDRVLALLDRFFSAMLAAVDKYEGHLERLDASGFVAVFNLPLAHSDHMARATRCAIECQTELVALTRSDRGLSAGKLGLAIGVASGPSLSGTIEGNGQPRYVAFGETLELAARLAAFTPAGQVWVNQRNAEALPLHIPSVMLAAISLRGRAQPVAPYRVWPPP